jgi:hypothetical protein
MTETLDDFLTVVLTLLALVVLVGFFKAIAR